MSLGQRIKATNTSEGRPYLSFHSIYTSVCCFIGEQLDSPFLLLFPDLAQKRLLMQVIQVAELIVGGAEALSGPHAAKCLCWHSRLHV
jgi:hypothetical protein